jgi:hypothetical protein
MKEELAGPHATVLKRLLMEQVATSWLAVRPAQDQAASPVAPSLARRSFACGKPNGRRSVTERRLNHWHRYGYCCWPDWRRQRWSGFASPERQREHLENGTSAP